MMPLNAGSFIVFCCLVAVPFDWGTRCARAQAVPSAAVGESSDESDSRDIVRDAEGNWAEMTELVVILVDEDHKPVAGAAIRPYAMQMVEQQGHGYWINELLGASAVHLSDAEGRASIRYPKTMHWQQLDLTTRLVTFNVQHTDHVTQTVHHDLGPETADVTLKPGCEFQVSATDSHGEAVKEFCVVMAGPESPQLWDQGSDGVKHAGSVRDGTWQTMLVQTREDRTHLFSSVFPLRFGQGQLVRLRNMPLSPGAVVNGSLSKNVTRPVRNGYVIVTSVPLPALSSHAKEDPSLTWQTWEAIEPDGTFKIPSIPRGGELQIIAVCEDWVSKTTVADAGSFVMGQLFDVDDDSIDIELDMERTGTLELSLQTPSGAPVSGGTISTWPNQRFYKGGSTILGRRWRTSDSIELQLLPADQRPTPVVVQPAIAFTYQPIVNGRCTLSGIPIGKSKTLSIVHDRYEFGKDIANDRGWIQYQLDSHEPKPIALTVIPRQEK